MFQSNWSESYTAVRQKCRFGSRLILVAFPLLLLCAVGSGMYAIDVAGSSLNHASEIFTDNLPEDFRKTGLKKNTAIAGAGIAEVNHRVEINCFGFGAVALLGLDMVHAQAHGSHSILMTRTLLGTLQQTDPRSGSTENASVKNQQALAQIEVTIDEHITNTSEA